MPNVEIIKEKNAVLVPIKDWERTQRELARLRKKVNKAKYMDDLRNALVDLKKDLADKDYDPDNELTADELLEILKNE